MGWQLQICTLLWLLYEVPVNKAQKWAQFRWCPSCLSQWDKLPYYVWTCFLVHRNKYQWKGLENEGTRVHLLWEDVFGWGLSNCLCMKMGLVHIIGICLRKWSVNNAWIIFFLFGVYLTIIFVGLFKVIHTVRVI